MLMRTALLAAITCFPASAFAGSPLIPRAEFFAPVARQSVKVSHDGQTLTYLAPHDGTWQIWSSSISNPSQAEVLTSHPRDISSYEWSFDSSKIVFCAPPEDGVGQHVFTCNPSNGQITDLTPQGGIFARIEKLSPHVPGHVVVSTNERNRALPDLQLLDMNTAKSHPLFVNDGLTSIIVDNTLVPRLGTRFTPEGDLEIVKLTTTGFEPFTRISPEDQLTTNIITFNKSTNSVVLLDARGRNTVAVVEKSLTENRERVLAADPEADIIEVLLDPKDQTVQAAASVYSRKNWTVLDESLKDDFALLRAIDDGDLRVESRSLNSDVWVVSFDHGSSPRRYFLYEKAFERATVLFSDRPGLDDEALAETEPVTFKSIDGVQLTGYLTRPLESGDATNSTSRLPMVVVVHDGPWSRDTFAFQPMHHWLANRGYAVLSINFRGSTGFGKNFLNAGNQQWGDAIFDDVLAGVQWAIDRRIADPQRIAILGSGFGGFVASLGATLTPTRFAGVVNLGGALDLVTFVQSMPTYWPPLGALVNTRIGRLDSESSMRQLYDQSPLSYAHRLKAPMLMIHGDDDALVPSEHVSAFATSAERAEVPFTSVRFEQGADILRPGNESLAALALVERFLGSHLGGRVEPVGAESRGVIVRVDYGGGDIGLANVPVGND